jgi:hypothetical protein
VLPLEPLITAVTLAELSVGPLVATTDEERTARQAHLQQSGSRLRPPSTPVRRALSGKLQLPFGAPAGSSPHMPSMR